MDLIQLKYFVGITSSPTMLQAARALNVSQSALSVSMKKLEAELGELKQSLREGRESARPITVAANATDFAVEAIALYRELVPAVPIRPIRSNAAGIRSLLAAREADLALTLAPSDSPHLTSVLLFREPMELLVDPKNPLRREGSVSLKQLEGCTLVTMGQGHDLRTLFDSFLRTGAGGDIHPGLHRRGTQRAGGPARLLPARPGGGVQPQRLSAPALSAPGIPGGRGLLPLSAEVLQFGGGAGPLPGGRRLRPLGAGARFGRRG